MGSTIPFVTATDDHGTLPDHAKRMLDYLETIERRHVYGKSSNMIHMDHAGRARLLADHLRAVVALSDAGRYPSALVVVRAALEHHLMDRLLFLSRLYVESYGGIRKEDIEAENVRLAALQAGPRPNIARWWRDDRTGEMNVVIRGIHSEKSTKGRGMIISPYYFRQDHFDPFTGGKKNAGKLARPFWRREDTQGWANEAAAAWHRWFVHDRVMKGLRVNRLLPRSEIHVDIHYGFLSGFAHPSKRGYESIYGHNHPSRMGTFDHYASELCLLYVITLAAAELDTYGRMTRRSPAIGLRGWDDVMVDVRLAQAASSYFWFLGDGPTMLDRIDTVHTPRARQKPKVGRPKIDPATLPAARVKYYADPLSRLVKLHHSSSEMTTGLHFQSPFERSDGRIR
jgi:hypothetical protein